MAAQLSGISTTPTQFSIIYENADSAICPIVQVTDGDVKEYWTQYPPLDFTKDWQALICSCRSAGGAGIVLPVTEVMSSQSLPSCESSFPKSKNTLAPRSVRRMRPPCCAGPAELHLSSGAPSVLCLMCTGVVTPVGVEDCASGTSTRLLYTSTLSSAEFLACCVVSFCCYS